MVQRRDLDPLCPLMRSEKQVLAPSSVGRRGRQILRATGLLNLIDLVIESGSRVVLKTI